MAGTVAYMAALHNEVGERAWEEVERTNVIAHELHQLMLKNSYTSCAFKKPRCYAGDAEMMDYLYDRNPPASASPLNQKLFTITTALPNSVSIADHRHRIAQPIDRAANEKYRPVRV